MSNQLQFELSNEMVRQTADLLDQSMVKIRHCLDQINETQIGWRPKPSMNSIANLMRHLAGNLRQWGVVPFTLATDRRDRDSEFVATEGESADERLQELQMVVNEAKEQWQHLTPVQLLRRVEIQGFDVNYLYAIVHTSTHFVGHTHQIIQLTRLQLGADYKLHWTPNQKCDDVPI